LNYEYVFQVQAMVKTVLKPNGISNLLINCGLAYTILHFVSVFQKPYSAKH